MHNTYKPLITIIETDTDIPFNHIHKKIQSTFQIPGCRDLFLNTQGWGQNASHYYIACSIRNPNNLQNHVQRIFHHISQHNCEQIYGALLDLFIVLKNSGYALKKRMMTYSQPFISAKQITLLEGVLHHNNLTKQTLPTSRYSILSSGHNINNRLIECTGNN